MKSKSSVSVYLIILFFGLYMHTHGQCTTGQPNISVEAEAFSSITIIEGTSATLNSPISGSSYQWTLNGINISGATTSSLTISNFSNTDVGDYNILVDGVGLSNSITLDIFSSSISDYDRDRQALIDFYNSTNGTSWTNNTNWLTGPLETWEGVKVENCRVTELRLSDNNIAGTIPTSFRDLSELKRLSLRNNNISGVLDISRMTSLLDLIMSGNSLTDIQFGSNNALQRVYIQDNPFTPGKTIDISSMRQLIDFRAARLNLSNVITSGNYDRLLYYIISENQITGTLDISTMPNLILLYAHNNQFTDFNLGTGTTLQRFYFYNNPIVAGRTMDISGMRNLLDFRVQGLGLSGLTISGDYNQMLYFIIRDNQIGGTLDISRMPNLRLLYAHNNQYTDFVVGSHPELSRFYFYNNPVSPGKTLDISSMRKLLDFRIQGLGLARLIMAGTYNEMLYFIIKDNQIGGTLDISTMSNISLCSADNNFFENLILPSNVTTSSRTLSQLFVRNNNLHFDDLLPYSSVIGAFNFAYNPQRNVPTTVSGNTVSVNVGGGLDYTWNPSGPNAASFVVSTSGTYSCDVRNAAIPNLVIKSDAVFVAGTSSREPNIDKQNTKEVDFLEDTNIFPNPVISGNPIQIEVSPKNKQQVNLDLYTIQGKKIINQSITKDKENGIYQISSGGLVPGIYMVSIEVGGKKVTKKIVVQ
ncbi:T9SS type A sorting domain-containing protein [Aquimarina litoralis]|uniref:T9SS type A sorting domain-containing protein n=1 Tax=Aquimarina litoralis TaxID=584605 RepID=UPI001C585E11|nr:T9SS type A sorting domain-containing protein [Aquimarina litoralis]MBW1295123.1 T9SS type A sorting domain-containing protein [Aquimarina litoralis]